MRLTPGNNVIKLFTPAIFRFSYQARVFVPGRPFQLSLLFAGKAKTYPRVEHLKGVSLVYADALPTDKILGWKDLPRTNTLTYYKY